MQQYFNMLKKKLSCVGKQDLSISELTKKIAILAGYKREKYVFSCGTSRIRTMYDYSFDENLTTQWIVHYAGIYYKTLMKYPDVKEHYVDIINETFYTIMNSLDLDLLVNDSSINAMFTFSLRSRIYDYLERAVKHRNILCEDEDLSNKINRLDTENNIEYNLEDNNDLVSDDCYIDVKNCVTTNIGKRLLFMMLNSGKKVQFRSIDKYLHLDIEQCNDVTKNQIVDSYNKIIDTFSTYVVDKKCRHITTKTLKYSFEKGVKV